MGEKKVISKEIKEKLSLFLAIDTEKEYKYTPDAFRKLDKSIQPVFTCKLIDGDRDIELLKIHNVMNQSGEINNVNFGDYARAVCNECVIGWKNFYNRDGEMVEYAGSCKGLPKSLIYELTNFIIGVANLSEEEEAGL